MEQYSDIINQYRKTRDFNTPPKKEIITQLFQIPEFQHVVGQIEGYKKVLAEARIDAQIINTVLHCIISHLICLLENDTPEYAYFMLLPTIDPHVEESPSQDNGLTLVAEWERRMAQRIEQRTHDIVSTIFRFSREEITGRAQSWFNIGSMYSDKTSEMLTVVEKIFNRAAHVEVHGYIASVMNENVIRTRRFGRPNTPLQIEMSMPAKPVSLEGFLGELEAYPPQAGDLVIVDEFSFMISNEQEAILFLRAIAELNERGVFVICSGLNTDFRGIPLPIIQYLEANPQKYASIHNCHAYCAYKDRHGKVVEVDTNGNGGSYTYRVDNVVGIGDLLLPVVVPRSQADIVSYHVTPASGNPFVNLKNHDQEAYEELMNITGIDALKQHYEEITVKET